MATFLPTVLIGVGGTGQSVLTYVKKELLETNEGYFPENVKLLCFDTMPEATVGGDQKISEQIISLGNVSLERNVEFIGLSGNGWALGQQVLRGDAPHIGKKFNGDGGYSWLDAEYLSKYPALWSLAVGAGQVRQFGRLGYFMKIDTAIQPRIKRAFESVHDANPIGLPVNIILVGSMAGGTGAGLFLDMAILCRSLSNILGNNVTIVGMYLQPRAFVGDAALGDHAKQMMARAFASWRELDRFMNVAEHKGQHVISYKGNHNMDIVVEKRPFDLCYMVDSYSTANALTSQPPMDGVYPVMADFINFMIDSKSGEDYQRHVANYIPEKGGVNKPGYSTLRTFSVRVPIFYDLESNALQLGRDVLERWLIPVQHEQTQAIIGLADNQNVQANNRKGKNDVVPFLSATNQAKDAQIDRMHAAAVGVGSTASQAVIQNTHFMNYIAQVYNWKATPDQLNAQVITDARGGFTYRGQQEEEGINMMTPIGRVALWPSDYADTEIILKGQRVKLSLPDILREAETSVWRDLKAMQQDVNDAAEALQNLKNPQIGVPEYDRTHFGEGAGDQGAFGRMLTVSRRFQVQRFRDLLRHWMANTLNGTVVDPLVGFTGRLGYVEGFLDGLVTCLDFFRNTYLRQVRQHRNAESPLSSAQRNEGDALVEAEANVDRKCIVFFEHPRARMTREQYLEAVNQRHTVQKDDLTLNSYEQIADELLVEARNAQEELQRWANALVLGGDNISGLYPMLQSEVRVVENGLQSEKKQDGVQHTLPEKRYRKVVGQLDEILSHLHWSVNNVEGFKIGCTIAVPQLDADGNTQLDASGVPVCQLREMMADDRSSDQKLNHDLLMELCRQTYKPMRQERFVLDELMRDKQYSKPIDLANDLHSHYGLLLEMDPGANAAAHDKSIFLRRMNPIYAKTPGVVQYVDIVRGQLNRTITPNNFFSSDSEDSYKLTLINTMDQIQDVEFSLWHRMKTDYLDLVMGNDKAGGPRLHIFPAECNAVRYELRLFSVLHKPYRMLHPKVVMLLENADRVSLFFRCLAFGFIKRYEDENSGEHKYELDMPYLGGLVDARVKIVLWTNINPNTGMVKPGEPSWPDTFLLLRLFLEGKDTNNPNSQILWDQLFHSIKIGEDKMRKTGELKTLVDDQITKPGEIISVLRRTAAEMMQVYSVTHANQVNPGSWSGREDGHEYLDLADVGEMMLKEVLDDTAPQVLAGPRD